MNCQLPSMLLWPNPRPVLPGSSDLDNMITFAEHIHRIQPIIDKMNAIHWKGSREKFQAAHQQEIDLYYTSQRILTEKHGVNKNDILR